VPYTDAISRSEAAALIPEDATNEILQGMPASSIALSMFRQVRMSRAQQRMPVLSALPTAYFVNGDTGLKQTTEQAWTNKYLDAEELAAIVPIPEAVLDDTSFDVWAEIRPRLQEAIGAALDAAVLFGTNKPASWPSDITTAAIAAGNNYNSGSVGPPPDLAGEVSTVMGLVEADGFMVTGFAAEPAFKAALRGLRDSQQGLLFQPSLQAGTPGTLYGETIQYATNGAWNSGAARMLAGDWRQGILGVRQDLTYKVLDQAVIQDNTGAIVYNLAQQDMVALRVTARFAFQVPNPENRLQPTDANRYPFAVLQP
jgi:HK97 family phage major capsid protein